LSSLLLASGSPRRLELLSAAGFEFEWAKPAITERADSNLTPGELTAWNAVGKGLAVARRFPEKVVLAADTIVAFENEIIGKPDDMSHAVRILQRLSGQTHHVYSSVFVVHLSEKRSKLFWELSRVRFRKISASEIRSYLEKIEPLDKAGAYAAQGHGAEIITEIDGSYSNVVGLPMEQTIAVLNEFEIRPTSGVTPPSPFRVEPSHAVVAVPGAKRGKGTKQ
jgi:septum formation protein